MHGVEAGGYGKVGGKGAGLFLAAKILRGSPEYASALADVRVPRTWYIMSDGIFDFIQYNNLEDVYGRKYLELDQIRREYSHILQVFKNSHFSPEIARGLAQVVDDLADRPLIVRSSSLLEDRRGAAFSGKYKSLFLANLGSRKERLAALQDAVAEVYASMFAPDPIEYRAERGLLGRSPTPPVSPRADGAGARTPRGRAGRLPGPPPHRSWCLGSMGVTPPGRPGPPRPSAGSGGSRAVQAAFILYQLLGGALGRPPTAIFIGERWSSPSLARRSG